MRMLGGTRHLMSWAHCRASGEGLQRADECKCGMGQRTLPCRLCQEPSSSPFVIVHRMYQTSRTHMLLIVCSVLGNHSPSGFP